MPTVDGTEINGSSDITIGENGNWFIDGVDTGNPSRGADGRQVVISATEPTNAVAGLIWISGV